MTVSEGNAVTVSGRNQDYMGFVGVTTADSSIMRVFPRWAEQLGLPTHRLRGHDLPLQAPPQAYRDVVTVIRDDPDHRGALVTSHKLALFDAAADLFDTVDAAARLFGEVSSIAKRDGRLVASARDPITVRLALEEFLARDHFATSGGAALVLGAGGAGCALTHYLAGRTDAPQRLICTDISAARLDHLRTVLERAELDPTRLDTVTVASRSDTDDLIATLPPGSLIANATGMGKDVAGSPISATVLFPQRCVVWEFNYRGPLPFLHQAREQQEPRDLTVVDGWRYFIHGWSQVITDVFELDLTPETVNTLADLAADVR